MERRCNKEFNEWVLKMLKKHSMTRKELGKEVGIDSKYISNILIGRYSTSKKTQYLIINFFKNEYDEIYENFAQEEASTFGEWLDDVMLKHRIKRCAFSKELNVSASTITNLRKGLVSLDILQREAILKILERDYEIDISKGKELLDSIENKYYKEVGEWICNAIETIGINKNELARCLDISRTTLFFIAKGKMVLCPERTEKMFEFFEKYGIDTVDGRKKFENAWQYKKSH